MEPVHIAITSPTARNASYRTKFILCNAPGRTRNSAMLRNGKGQRNWSNGTRASRTKPRSIRPIDVPEHLSRMTGRIAKNTTQTGAASTNSPPLMQLRTVAAWSHCRPRLPDWRPTAYLLRHRDSCRRKGSRLARIPSCRLALAAHQHLDQPDVHDQSQPGFRP